MDSKQVPDKYKWEFPDGGRFFLVRDLSWLKEHWPVVRDLLNRVLLPTEEGATVDVEHILLGIVTQSLFLFVDCDREGVIKNIVVTEFITYPKQQLCFRILYTAGTLEESWKAKLACLEDFANVYNASGCEIWARFGFKRFLCSAGYRPVQMQFYKRFINGTTKQDANTDAGK